MPTIDGQPSPNGAVPTAAPRPRLVESAIVFLIGAALMAWVYGGWMRGDAAVPGNDSFYHIKMASMMPQAATMREFPWLRFCYFTDRGESFVSHHYGFHLLLAPFVKLSHRLTGSYLPGGRWAMCVFFGLLALALHHLAAHSNPGWRWIWLPLLVLLPFQFFTRHAFVRAITPSLAFMLLINFLAFRRRFVWMAPAVGAYVHLYMGGVLFGPVVVIAYVVSVVLCGEPRSYAWKAALWSVGGWIVAILVHPYREGMWEFLRLQVFGSGLSPDIAVGKEWRPYSDVWWFTAMCGPLLGVWIAAVAARLCFAERLGAEELTLFLLNVGFFVLTAKARRFIEYWPAFCMLSAVFLARPALLCLAKLGRESVPRRLGPFAARQGAVVCAVLAASVAGFSPQWRGIRKDAACDFNVPAIESAMRFLRDNSESGDVVFTDDWDVFPIFFYYNSHNHYIVGLDPKFTHGRRPDLWARYVRITRGQTPARETVAMPDGQKRELSIRLEDIRDHFGARWVVVDREHKALADDLADAKEFAELAYPTTDYAEAQDKPYLVFHIR